MLAPSPSNALELCVGTIAEMTEGDVYDAVDRYSRQGKIAYIHLRNVVGKVPTYRETFIDEGDVDMTPHPLQSWRVTNLMASSFLTTRRR